MCSSLTSVTIPIGVRSIEEWAFYACESLTSITLPEGLTSINGAFYFCSNLKSVSIPNSVTNIGNNSFHGCSSLVSITLPDNLAKLGSMAFYDCTSLSSIVIPNGVTSIGYATFQGCKALSSIDLHEGIVSVGDYAFAYCSALNFIVSKAELPPVAKANTFSRVDKTIPVYVPNVTAYKSADYWKEFTNYIALSVPEQEIEIYDSEAEFVSPTFEDYDKVSYHRTFNNTNWQALYVPFEIPVTAEFLADFEVAYINNVHQRDYDDDGVTEQTEVEAFKITKGTLRANYPYLIRAKEAGKKIITVTNTTLYATEENSIDCASVFRTYTFTGTYKRLESKVLPQSEGYYALSGGKWKPIATGSSLGAFRFYLQVKSRGGDAATKALSIRMRIFDEYGNEEITEVEEVEANLPAEDVVYDLQGRRVEVPGKGVYIVNGKKMVF